MEFQAIDSFLQLMYLVLRKKILKMLAFVTILTVFVILPLEFSMSVHVNLVHP